MALNPIMFDYINEKIPKKKCADQNCVCVRNLGWVGDTFVVVKTQEKSQGDTF